MSTVEIPFDGSNNQDLAILLLAAAEKLHGDQSVVNTKVGAFVVPEDVAKEAGVKEAAVPQDEAPVKKAPAKKTAAKKAPAKKAAAKKSTTKQK